MREMRFAMVGLAGFTEWGSAASPFRADRCMPAKACVTCRSPWSLEICDVAVEETVEGTGEGDGGVMCGNW
jgi:hypothetical protein